MNYYQMKAARPLLTDLQGRTIVRPELSDAGCIGLTLEGAELTITARLDRLIMSLLR